MTIIFIPSRCGYERALENQKLFTPAQRQMAISHRHLAYFVIRNRSLSPAKRKRIFERDGGICRHCGVTLDVKDFHVDHFIAVANGGDDSDENLVASCPPCNLSKGAKWA